MGIQPTNVQVGKFTSRPPRLPTLHYPLAWHAVPCLNVHKQRFAVGAGCNSPHSMNEWYPVPRESFLTFCHRDVRHACNDAASQELSAFPRHHRLAEIVALPEWALMVLKECKLLQSFNAFGDHLHMQVAAHADHRSDDAGVVRIGSDTVHE